MTIYGLKGNDTFKCKNLEVDTSVTLSGASTISGAITATGGLATDNLVGTVTTYEADGAISTSDIFVELDASSATTAMTIAAPVKGQFLVISCADASNAVTVTLTAGTFDGTNNVATFDATEETLVLFGISATRYVIIENIGAVVLS